MYKYSVLYCWYFKYGILGWHFAFQIEIAERSHSCTKTSTHSIYCQIGHLLFTFSFNISQVLTNACLQEHMSLWILHSSMNAVFSSFCHWRLPSNDPTGEDNLHAMRCYRDTLPPCIATLRRYLNTTAEKVTFYFDLPYSHCLLYDWHLMLYICISIPKTELILKFCFTLQLPLSKLCFRNK